MRELGAREQFVLAVSEQGFGKRTSSYEYRTMGRGAQGIVAMAMRGKNAAIVAAFPVEDSDHLMLITDQGKTIRVPVSGISVQRRSAQGVVLFRLDEGERVVSVERIAESSGEGRRMSEQAHRALSRHVRSGHARSHRTSSSAR